MNKQFMSHIKLAEMRATEEGHNLLIKLMNSPGQIATTQDLEEDSLIDSIKEGGGSVWWCGTCDVLCSPNRPCVCKITSNKRINFSSSTHQLDDNSEEENKITLMLSSEEFEHVLRALKFCRHIKLKSKMNPADQNWVNCLSKIIEEIGE